MGKSTIEERLDGETDPNQQYVWGLRYIDDLILRDRDTDDDGSLDERLYALQDANWNIAALSDAFRDILERYSYLPYGRHFIFSQQFSNRVITLCDWQVLYCGRLHDSFTAIYYYRRRYMSTRIGQFLSRDPSGYHDAASIYSYTACDPLNFLDPLGLFTISNVDSSPKISFDPDSAYGAGIYYAVWIDLSGPEKRALAAAGGGYLVETNEAEFEVRKCNGMVEDHKKSKLWFLMYYVMKGKEVIPYHSHGDQQYKQIVNWGWGDGKKEYPLKLLKECSKGFVDVKSDFELYAKGSTELHRDRFHHSHDVQSFTPADEFMERTETTYGEHLTRIAGERLDEVGFISGEFPWRKGAPRKKISKVTLRLKITWDWCASKPASTITVSAAPGGTPANGPDRSSNLSEAYGERPDWDL